MEREHFAAWLQVHGLEWLSLQEAARCAASAREASRLDFFVSLQHHDGLPPELETEHTQCVNGPDGCPYIAQLVERMWRAEGSLLRLLFEGREGIAAWPCERRRVCASLGVRAQRDDVPSCVSQASAAWATETGVVYCQLGILRQRLWCAALRLVTVQQLRRAAAVCPFELVHFKGGVNDEVELVLLKVDLGEAPASANPLPFMAAPRFGEVDEFWERRLAAREVWPRARELVTRPRRSLRLVERPPRDFFALALLDEDFPWAGDMSDIYVHLAHRGAPSEAFRAALEAFLDMWEESGRPTGWCWDCQRAADLSSCGDLEGARGKNGVREFGCLVRGWSRSWWRDWSRSWACTPRRTGGELVLFGEPEKKAQRTRRTWAWRGEYWQRGEQRLAHVKTCSAPLGPREAPHFPVARWCDP